jgi:hypothetical protein
MQRAMQTSLFERKCFTHTPSPAVSQSQVLRDPDFLEPWHNLHKGGVHALGVRNKEDKHHVSPRQLFKPGHGRASTELIQVFLRF